MACFMCSLCTCARSGASQPSLAHRTSGTLASYDSSQSYGTWTMQALWDSIGRTYTTKHWTTRSMKLHPSGPLVARSGTALLEDDWDADPHSHCLRFISIICIPTLSMQHFKWAACTGGHCYHEGDRSLGSLGCAASKRRDFAAGGAESSSHTSGCSSRDCFWMRGCVSVVSCGTCASGAVRNGPARSR